MQKKVLFVVMILLVFAALGCNVYAVTITAVNPDIKTQQVTVVGTCNSAEGDVIQAAVVAPSKLLHPQQPYYEGEVKDTFSYFDEIPVGSGGTFHFSFKPNSGEGTYTIRVKENNSQNPFVERTVVFVPVSVLEAATEAINMAARIEDLSSKLTPFLLICDNPLYVNLKNPQAVAKYVFLRKPYDKKESDKVIGNIINGTTVEALNEAHTADEVKLIVETYADITKLINSSRVKDTFNNPDMIKEKLNVYGHMINKSPESFEDAVLIFESSVITSSIENVSNWTSVEEIMDKNRSIIGISDSMWAQFNSLKNKSVVLRAIAGVSYESCESLLRDFNNGVLSAMDDHGETRSSGGGGKKKVYSGDYSISPIPEQPQSNTEPFVDVDNVAWAKESIQILAEKGILEGRGDKRFAPEDIVTREEFVKILISALDITKADAKCTFIDVEQDRWSYKYIALAAEIGIVNGIDQVTFGVLDPVSRQDMAVMVYQAAHQAGIELKKDKLRYSDAEDISGYAIDAVEAMSSSGIVNGMDDGRFLPKEQLTRAQAAKVIHSILLYAGKL